MRNLVPLALLVACSLSMPGCIIWDAYDQVELANQQLGQINRNLEEIDANLAQIDAKLATIDENLETVDASLAEIKPMLATIDEHLASLRTTINNIDSTIPFLGLSGDSEEDQEALESGETPVESPAPASDEQDGDEVPTPPSR